MLQKVLVEVEVEVYLGLADVLEIGLDWQMYLRGWGGGGESSQYRPGLPS